MNALKSLSVVEIVLFIIWFHRNIFSEQCEDLVAPDNAIVKVEKKKNVFIAEYSCEEGFALTEESVKVKDCDPNPMSGLAQWLPSTEPKCQGIYISLSTKCILTTTTKIFLNLLFNISKSIHKHLGSFF